MPISTLVKRAYFGVKIGDQNKQRASHVTCKTSVKHLRHWNNEKMRSLQFGVSMVWREPKNYHDDCYIFMVNIKGINRNN